MSVLKDRLKNRRVLAIWLVLEVLGESSFHAYLRWVRSFGSFLAGLRKQILCIFTVGAAIGLVLGMLEEAVFMHIYGGCGHWACSWQA